MIVDFFDFDQSSEKQKLESTEEFKHFLLLEVTNITNLGSFFVFNFVFAFAILYSFFDDEFFVNSFGKFIFLKQCYQLL